MAKEAQAFTSHRFRRLFLAEAADVIAAMERDLLRLTEETPSDTILQSVFRAAHTLKGNAAMTGYGNAAELLHAIETAYQELRAKTRKLTPELLQTLLEATDCIREILDAEPTDPIPQRAQSIQKVLRGTATFPEDQNPQPQITLTPEQSYRITWTPAADTIARGADPIRCLSALRKKTNDLQIRCHWKAVPAIQEIRPDHAYLSWHITLVTREHVSSLREWFDLAGPHTRLEIQTSERQAASTASAHLPPQTPKPNANYLRVSTKKLDQLLNLTVRILDDQSLVLNVPPCSEFTRDILTLVAKVNRNTHLLHRELENLRQVEISQLFHRLPRLVHDLSIQLRKQIRIKIEGGDTRLDRSLAEGVGDTLVHLIRNCADHGIEMPAERLTAGKTVYGIIHITAHHQSGHAIIEISDDGRGLPLTRIFERAASLGIIDPNDHLDQEQLTQLIFHPGLSTADSVTPFSGRGVGMDAVRAALQSMNGTIEVSTNTGRGCSFRLSIPNATRPLTTAKTMNHPGVPATNPRMPAIARPPGPDHLSAEESHSPDSDGKPPTYPLQPPGPPEHPAS